MSASDSAPPEHRCGYELQPEDLGIGVEADGTDLRQWRADWQTASCCRDVSVDGRCRLHAAGDVHADAADIREELTESDGRVRNLDGVSIQNVEFEDTMFFSDCRLRGATLDRVTAFEADFTNTELTGTKFSRVDLSHTDFVSADLSGCEFHNSDLWNTDFSGADLRQATITDSNFPQSSFTNADLAETTVMNADFARTTFVQANLWNSEFRNVDLTEAEFKLAVLEGANVVATELPSADLSKADLRATTFVRADVREIGLANIEVNQQTTVRVLPSIPEASTEWDSLARSYHEFKEVFSDNGLDEKARGAYQLERICRAREARVAGGRGGWTTYLASQLSRYLTGYGVRVSYVFAWTVLLVGLTALWYELVGIEGGSIYYSVVTFTTSPPHPPRVGGSVTRVIALFETYVGTLLTVLIGYVLGNRERF